MSHTASQIAQLLGGEVIGDGAVALSGFAPANAAKPGDLTFAETAGYFTAANQSAASAILVSGDYGPSDKAVIKVANARVAFAKILPLFFPEPVFAPGIHPTAVVDPTAQIDPAAHIGPHCVVQAGAQIGAKVVLESLVHVGANCRIGESTHLFPQVTIYPQTQIGCRVRIHSSTVVGSDGFGYVLDQGQHLKVPQIGIVIIHDDVELGSNVSVDRGALGPTIIGRGTKVDNLVQIAHNVIIGEHCILVAHAAVAGSSKLGNYVVLAGQVGIVGHVKIGNRVTIAGQSGVMTDIPDDEKYMGSPAQPDKQCKRQLIALTQLPELIKRVRALEKKLNGE